MGEALDWVRQVALENNWKTLKIRVGPGVYFLVGNHPEAAQVILRSGIKYLLRVPLDQEFIKFCESSKYYYLDPIIQYASIIVVFSSYIYRSKVRSDLRCIHTVAR